MCMSRAVSAMAAFTRTAESARIARQHRAGSVGALLGQTPRRRGGAKPRDFQRENVRAIRDIQRRLRAELEEKSRLAPHETFKLHRFDNVPPRLHQPAPPRAMGLCETAPIPPRPGFSTIVFTPPPRSAAAPQRLAPGPCFGGHAEGMSTPSPVAAPQQRRPPLRRSRSAGSLGAAPGRGSAAQSRGLDDEDEDESGGAMICAAAFERSVAELRRFQLQQPSGLHGCARGQLEENRGWVETAGRGLADDCDRAPAWWPAQGAAEARAAARASEERAAPMVAPSGYRFVPEPERLQTLSDLRCKLADLNERYARSPLRIETEGQRKTQELLRAKLQETENAVKLFSRAGGVLVEK